MDIKGKLLALKSTYFDNNSVSGREMLGFAGGIFGNAMGQDSVDTFADKFDRNHMGISNTMLTVKGNISTILGFFIPPVAGALYDIPSRSTKRSNIRTALMTAPIPFAITSMLLFIVPTHNALYNFIWTLFFNILFSIADTFYDIALSALALKMVSDPSDRKKFYTFESIASTLGSMAPGGIIPIFVGMTDDAHKQQWIYFFIALAFCIIGIIAMYAPYMNIAERAEFSMKSEAVSEEKAEKIKWDKRTVLALLHNRPFMVLQLSSLFDNIRQMTYRLLPYLYDDTFGDFKMKAVIDAVSGSLSYVGLMAVPFVGKKISAKAMLAGGYGYTAFFYGLMSLFNINFDLESIRRKRYFLGMFVGFGGVPNAAQGAARKIITADSTDYMEWYSEKKYGVPLRSDGLLSAAQNIVGKVNSLIKTNMYNGIFHVIGYKAKDLNSDAKPVQSVATLKGIYMAATLCGMIGNALPSICFLLDNYTGKRKEEIYAELVAMREKRKELENEFQA